MIQSIAHATDFTPASEVAFAHALRLAVACRCRLDILHVRTPDDDDAWHAFPSVRETLARWGLLAADTPREAIATEIGVDIRKVEISYDDPAQGVAWFLATHRPEMLILATRGNTGFGGWLTGSISENIARDTHIPTLFVGPEARPFVDTQTGQLDLARIAIPVARSPRPDRALHTLATLFEGMALSWHCFHVGNTPPLLNDARGIAAEIKLVDGPLVESIVSEAKSARADLLAMPTAGHDGFLDILRGSTTELVLRRAPCPVLALPA